MRASVSSGILHQLTTGTTAAAQGTSSFIPARPLGLLFLPSRSYSGHLHRILQYETCAGPIPLGVLHTPHPPFQLSHSSPFGASVPDPLLCHPPSVALPLFLFLHSIRSTITTLTVGRVSRLRRRRQQNSAQPAHICTIPTVLLRP